MRAIGALATAVLLAAAAIITPGHADDYPSRPVHIVVGFIPGSAADITARVLGNGLTRLLGQQFVVENKPGAGSSLAGEFSARAPRDGYTLFPRKQAAQALVNGLWQECEIPDSPRRAWKAAWTCRG